MRTFLPTIQTLQLQYVALFSGHPYFRTLRLYDSVFRCKRETNSNDTFQRLVDLSAFVRSFRGRATLRLGEKIQVFVEVFNF